MCTTTSRMWTSSRPASRRCKRSSPDARGLRPVPGADPGPLQASEEQRASSPPCDAPRGPGEEGRLDVRPPKSMSPDPPSPDGSRLADRIGHTPLFSLDRIASHVARGVRISAKAEWLNPGGSVKDRAALG